jgi:hypothetical protein
MKIPAFLNATYSGDLKLNAFVSQSLSYIEGHIEANRPIFFPEYTDHSARHIELVLQTAIDFASLPVNLQRDGLQEPIPFEEELLVSVCDDLIAHAFVEAPNHCNSGWLRGIYEGFVRHYEEWPAWLIGREGFVLNEGLLVAEFNPRFLVVALGGDADLANWGVKIQRALGPDGLMVMVRPNVLSDTNPRIKGLFIDSMNGHVGQPGWLLTDEFATYIPSSLIDKVKKLKPGRVVSKALNRLEPFPQNNGWRRIESAPIVHEALDEAITSLSTDPKNPIIFFVLQIEIGTEYGCSPPLAKRWMEVLRTPMVPFSAKNRKLLEDRVSGPVRKMLDIRRSSRKKKTKKSDENL